MLVHHLLLLAAVGLLFDAGARGAGQLSQAPLVALLVAVVFAASLAAIEALALGLAGLGTSPLALTAAAAASAVAARLLIAPAGVPLGVGLRDGWLALPRPARIALGAAAGAAIAWTVWLLRHPAFDWDNLAYHIPEVVAWVHNGRPGSLVDVLPGFPYANLPVTNEVLLSWATGIARSFVPIAVWPTLLVSLLAIAGWVGLRTVRVAPIQAALAVGSLCAAPMLTSFQGNGANSDLPAVVWMVVTAALCAAAVVHARPALLGPAMLAAALAIGTKTTVAPLALAALISGFWSLRSPPAPHRGVLLLCGCAAVAVGGIWYLRDLFDHGSPLWPYYAAPWGDALPHLQQPDTTFFHRPLATLARFGESGYVTDTFLGGLVPLAGALIAPLLVRRRAVAASALATLVTMFLWTFAPDTGAPYPNFPATDAFHGSPRFLVPSVAAATLTLALAGRDGRRGVRMMISATLAAALVLNVVQLFGLGLPRVPGLGTPVVGALAGAAVVAVGSLVGKMPISTRRPRMLIPRAATAIASLGLAAALTVGGHGFAERAEAGGYAPLLRWFASSGRTRGPIYTAPVQLVLLTQDELTRQVFAVRRTESCGQIAEQARAGWLVVLQLPTQELLGPSTTASCVRRWRPVYDYADADFIYDGRSPQ